MFHIYVLILLVINFAIAAGYLLWMCLVKKDCRKGIILSLFCLLVPVIGIIFIASTKIVDLLFYRKENGSLDKSDLSFEKIKSRMIVSDDVDKESDKVPLEEAFMLSDSSDRRNAFLEVLKDEDSEEFIPKIQDAMNYDDTEVVHYAATYITDTIARYKENELKLRKACQEKEDTDLYLNYLHYCGKILSTGVLSEPDERRYLVYYENFLERLFQFDYEKTEPVLIAQIISLYKRFGEEELRKKWVDRMELYLDQDIIAAKEILKYYFEIHDNSKFYNSIEKIKNSPLELDAELLDWIRMF